MTRESNIVIGPKRKKLQSFAGYPITHENKVIEVLAMFSTRSTQAADLEVLGVFSDQISKELKVLPQLIS